MEGIPVRLIPYAGLLSSVLGNIDTKDYDYESLNNEISNVYRRYLYKSVHLWRKGNRTVPSLL